MRSTVQILANYRDTAKQRFLDVIGRVSSVPDHIPTDPEAAMRMGMALGRKEGYGTGLVDGTKLGLGVGLDAVDEMLNQPVIFGSVGQV